MQHCSDKVHVVPWVGMNPEHPKIKPFIHLEFTTLNVNEVASVITSVVYCICELSSDTPLSEVVLGVPHPLPFYNWSPFAQDVIIPNGLETT